MNILGISAFYHDAAACLLQDGEIVAAAQEERFTRRKHDPSFPRHAIAYCLREAGIGVESLDRVAFYEKHWIRFERLLESYLAHAPAGLRSFLLAMPVWLKRKLWLARLLEDELGYTGEVVFPEHHESHAASAFFASPFRRAAILTMDAVGEWASSAWGTGSGHRVDLEAELEFPHSLGMLYSAFTYYAGFRVNSGEYKLMGLAPYGNSTYAQTILDELVDLRPDGSLRLNMRYFDFAHGLTMTSDEFHELFGAPPRRPDSELDQRHADLARSIQEVTEEAVLRAARHVRRATGERALCMAGGVALNSVANGRLLRESGFDDVWIQPAAGDAGGALGAALFAWHVALGRERSLEEEGDRQRGSLLGPAFDSERIGDWLTASSVPHRRLAPEELSPRVAELIADGSVVGWFQGRMEFGPRALGARSILADPRDPGMRDRINRKIKFRESFRPFAPACLLEDARKHFEIDRESPYMLFVVPVAASARLPAVTHVDGSARLQTVDGDDDPRFHDLLRAFEAETGVGVLVNTSFNRRGEPIVCTPADAYRCFMASGLDALVLEDFLLLKEDQEADAAPELEDPYRDEFRPVNPHGEGDVDVEGRELRRFGLVMAGAFAVLGGVALWRGSSTAVYLGALAGAFAVTGLVVPSWLGPVRRAWMALAERLGGIVNVILLTLVYLLLVTPMGLVARMLGRDRLQLRSPPRESYWVRRDTGGEGPRHTRPY